MTIKAQTPDIRQYGPLNERERAILDVLVTLHGEYGLDHRFTRTAIEHLTGEPCPGSLAGLAMKGYVAQETDGGQVAYRVLERGFELYAGVEGQMG